MQAPGGGAAARDRELFARVQAGEEAAFDELYRLYRDWVHRLAWRLTGDAEAAQDLLQEAFLYLVRRSDELSLQGKLSTLLYPVVKHLASARARRAERWRSDEELLQGLAEEARPRLEGDEGEVLAASLGRLNEGQREVLFLRVVEGFSVEEVGQALEVPPGTVKSRLFHALALLREDPRLQDLWDP